MNSKNRYYDVDGEDFISVTSILKYIDKPALRWFYAKNGYKKANEIANHAATTGTKAHEYIENHSQGVNVDIDVRDKNLVNAIQNYHEFYTRYKPIFAKTELQVSNAEWKYAGTLDAILIVKDKLVMVDWKTSSGIFPEYELQLNAYYQALTDMKKRGILDIEVPQCLWAVRFCKKNPIDFRKDVVKYKPSEKAFQAFLGLMDFHNWTESRRKK